MFKSVGGEFGSCYINLKSINKQLVEKKICKRNMQQQEHILDFRRGGYNDDRNMSICLCALYENLNE